jgi:uncharacterized surface protein with fasciclin (FAS1) repeats
MIPKTRRGLLALGTLAAGALAAPGLLRAQQGSPRTLADTMAGDSRFARFLDMLTRAGAVEDFRQPGPMTVVAPVDQAFAGAPAGLLQDLMGGSSAQQNSTSMDRQRVMALIRYHMVPGTLGATELGGGDHRVRTLNGGDILISGSGTTMTVRNPAPGQQLGSPGVAGFNIAATPAQVLGSPTIASNGVLYPISQLLFP